MVQCPDQHARHFAIGEVHVALRTPIRSLRKQYVSLYEAFQTDRPGGDEIRIDVRPTRLSLRHRRRYEIRVNERLRFEPTRFDEVLPYVEWAVNWELARVMPDFLQLHASSMEVNGQGVILPGASGSGKSTLTLGLMTRDWHYLCDEFALLHTDTLNLHPYPRAICVKKPSFAVARSLGVTLRGDRHHHKGIKGDVAFVNPLDVRPNAIGRPCPIRYVIFPKYKGGAKPALAPISRAEAAFDLHRVCFNLFGCNALGVDVLAAMIRGATCYRLVSGEIEATCDLLQALVQGMAAKQSTGT